MRNLREECPRVLVAKYMKFNPRWQRYRCHHIKVYSIIISWFDSYTAYLDRDVCEFCALKSSLSFSSRVVAAVMYSNF